MSGNDRRAIRDKFLDVLLTAAEERGQRENLVDTDDGPECAWVLYERERMLTAVNTERASRKLPPADLDTVKRLERQAAGHIDYAKKFALHCAELAIGIGPAWIKP